MPKYMILNSTYLKVAGQSAARLFEIGDVVDYAGVPGSALAPMDAEARAAWAAMLAAKAPRARDHLELNARKWRRLLSGEKLRALEAAEAAEAAMKAPA